MKHIEPSLTAERDMNEPLDLARALCGGAACNVDRMTWDVAYRQARMLRWSCWAEHRYVRVPGVLPDGRREGYSGIPRVRVLP